MKEEELDGPYNICHAPGTCCPEMDYFTEGFRVLENGSVWEILRCINCGTYRRKYIDKWDNIRVIE